MRKDKVILFGAGLIGRQVFPKLGNHVHVLAFSDNDTNKQGGFISGIPVISPDNIKDFDFDAVLISSTSITDIRDQLLELGINKEKIVVLNEEQGGSPDFPWDAVLFLFYAPLIIIGLLIYLFRWILL